jgi:WD40 repeat protein
VLAYAQGNVARTRQRIATAGQLVAQADALRDSDPGTAMLLGIAADGIHPDGRTHSSLVNTMVNSHYAGTLRGQGRAVNGVAFTPDGRTLATAGGDASVMLWDVAARASLARLTGHKGDVYSVAFSPDGRTLVSGSWDETVIVWDVADRKRPVQLGRPLHHGGAVRSMAFTPDGRTLAAGGEDGGVVLWDMTHRTEPIELASLPAHERGVAPVAFGPDGRILATGGGANRTVVLWDLADVHRPRRLGRPLTGPTDAVTSVALSADGPTLAAGSADHSVTLWDLGNPIRPRRLGRPLTGPVDAVTAVTFSPDAHTLAAGSADNRVVLWNVADPAKPARMGGPLSGHADALTSLVAVRRLESSQRPSHRPLNWGFCCAPRGIRTPNRQIRSLVLYVDLVGSRRIWPAHVGRVVDLVS